MILAGGLITTALCGGGGSGKLITKSVNEYGTYTLKAEDDGADGYSEVNVSLPDRYNEGYNDGYNDGYNEGYKEGESHAQPNIKSLTVTANGVYTASGCDGYSPVIVNVPSGQQIQTQTMVETLAAERFPRSNTAEYTSPSNHNYSVSISRIRYDKPNNFSWMYFDLEIKDETGEVVFSKTDVRTFDQNGGTDFLYPYVEYDENQTKFKYPVVSGTQWTGYIQNYSWFTLN